MGNVCSISISIDNMISGCWAATGGQATYCCEFEEKFDAVKLALEDLKDFRNDMKRKIDTFEEQRLEQLDQVRRWFSRVEDVETEASQLIKDGTTEIQKLCLGGYCSRNCISSYRLGKKLAKKVEDLNNLRSTRLFDMVADRLPPASVDERPSEPTVGMMSIFNKVWSCLGEEQVGIIGLYGLGGVGKTTLLTQINNEFLKTTHDFDVVIWAVVSRDPDFPKVQDEIGKKVGFCDGIWRNKSKDEKAIDVFRALRKKRFVLLLDDIWEPVNLSVLGVPVANEENKSKLVFTTRSEDVCRQMEAEKNIKVECLAWQESWDLFQKKVGQDTLDSHAEIPMLAEIVAKECCGLPLALVIIGRAMACKKTTEEWNYAIKVLQGAASIFPGMGDRVFPILKFSFDSLPSDAIKSCFLYCSLFPEDFNILKENLIDYWIGEGFLHEFDDIDEARNQGHNIIGILLNACLLEKSSRDIIRMHDVVRDMALWIACEHGKVKDEFFVRTRVGLIEAPEFTRWVSAKRIS